MDDSAEKEEPVVKTEVEKIEDDGEQMNGVDHIKARSDLTPYFEKSDHSVNKLHFSKVSDWVWRD